MTLIRISVLCIDAAEREAALALLKTVPAPERNGDYLIGLIEEARLEDVDRSGLIYNAAVNEPASVATSTGTRSGTTRADVGVTIADAASDVGALRDATYQQLDDLIPGEDPQQFGRAVVTLAQPLTASLQQHIAAAGAHIERRLDDSRYLLNFSGNLDSLRDIAAIDDARWYDRSDLLDPDIIAAAVRARLSPPFEHNRSDFSIDLDGLGARFSNMLNADTRFEMPISDTFGGVTAASAALLPFDARCHDAGDTEAMAAKIRALPGVDSVEVDRDRIRYWTPENGLEAVVVSKVAGFGGLDYNEPFVAPELLLDWARACLWGEAQPQPAGRWRGAGQLVAIVDTGVDQLHPDLVGRVKKRDSVLAADNRDPAGHGTHVASIIAGDGTASNGELAGIAPEAKLFVRGIADAGGAFTGMAVSLKTPLQEAYDEGARIQNFSWGSRVASRYVLNTQELDEFVAEHPDHLVVVAAGNWGVQDLDDPNKPIGLLSLGAPAGAKNCLAVGACCSPRTDGPYTQRTWAEYDGSAPPSAAPMATLPLTGDPDIVASLSSRGPSDEGRVKPDLVAVGIGVAAARSHDRAGNVKPWGTDGNYMYLSGTSMAAPVVSGAAAVLRGYFIDQRAHTPSAALLKATLINGATWIPGSVQEDPAVGMPNFHQGFGRLDLSRTFPVDEQTPFALTFDDIDDAHGVEMEKPNKAAVNWRRRFVVNTANRPLAVTMCWTDPPGRGLNHELDLLLIAPDGTKNVGNNALVRLPYQKSDRTNNVEKVVIETPMAGEWIVMVTAYNTYKHAQGFGLAATGDITDWIA
ncbi:hypothetical protein BH10PSE14_BH10PSE14_30740 [soil metagenome]